MTAAEKHYQDALDVLGTTFAAANELNHALEEPIRDEAKRERVHELIALLSGSLMILPEYDAYTGGIMEAIEDTRDRAIVALGETSLNVKYEGALYGLAA